MNVIGTVVSVEMGVSIAKNGGGSYQGTRFSYRDRNGALKEQAFHNNFIKFNPGIATTLSNMNPGDSFVMVKEKEGEFWNVKSISVGDQPLVAQSAGNSKVSPTPSPKSNYETPEERAKRQVYIVRQSSISSAVGAATLLKLKSKEDILNLAKYFEAYVFGTEFDDGTIMSLPSDDLDVE